MPRISTSTGASSTYAGTVSWTAAQLVGAGRLVVGLPLLSAVVGWVAGWRLRGGLTGSGSDESWRVGPAACRGPAARVWGRIGGPVARPASPPDLHRSRAVSAVVDRV